MTITTSYHKSSRRRVERGDRLFKARTSPQYRIPQATTAGSDGQIFVETTGSTFELITEHNVKFPTECINKMLSSDDHWKHLCLTARDGDLGTDTTRSQLCYVVRSEWMGHECYEAGGIHYSAIESMKRMDVWICSMNLESNQSV